MLWSCRPKGQGNKRGVREDHTAGGEPINAVVAVHLQQSGSESGRVLLGGHDFFASPRLSPDGRWLVWLAWDHPNMPWNGTTLYLSERDADGNTTEPRTIAGGLSESIFQPEWSPEVRSFSCLTAATGGISTASILPRGHLSRSPRCQPSLARHYGNLVHRHTRAPAQIGSSAPIPRPGSTSLRCWGAGRQQTRCLSR
jgi:hypothetical protein